MTINHLKDLLFLRLKIEHLIFFGLYNNYYFIIKISK